MGKTCLGFFLQEKREKQTSFIKLAVILEAVKLKNANPYIK